MSSDLVQILGLEWFRLLVGVAVALGLLGFMFETRGEEGLCLGFKGSSSLKVSSFSLLFFFHLCYFPSNPPRIGLKVFVDASERNHERPCLVIY